MSEGHESCENGGRMCTECLVTHLNRPCPPKEPDEPVTNGVHPANAETPVDEQMEAGHA